jgi:hypothetical protein
MLIIIENHCNIFILYEMHMTTRVKEKDIQNRGQSNHRALRNPIYLQLGNKVKGFRPQDTKPGSNKNWNERKRAE